MEMENLTLATVCSDWYGFSALT